MALNVGSYLIKTVIKSLANRLTGYESLVCILATPFLSRENYRVR